MKTIIFRFGKPHLKKIAAFELDALIFHAGKELNMSKSEVKRYLDQEAVYITFENKEIKDLKFKN